MFYCNICEIFKNAYCEEQQQMTTSEFNGLSVWKSRKYPQKNW